VTLELDFHEAMVELYRRAKSEIHYTARYFIDMVSNEGGRETARYLLDTNEPSDGYVVLWENGRLDLSVEAEVLRPQCMTSSRTSSAPSLSAGFAITASTLTPISSGWARLAL
jgi:hypothetical protein